MALRLNKTDAPVWVTDADLAQIESVIVTPDADAAYLIKPIRKADADRLRKPYVRMRYDPRTHRQVEDEMTPADQEALSLDTLDYVLVDWRGYVTDDDGTPLPCTRENKAFIDTLRSRALVHLAMLTQAQRAEDRAASFRGPAGVGGVGPAQRGADAVLSDGVGGPAPDGA